MNRFTLFIISALLFIPLFNNYGQSIPGMFNYQISLRNSDGSPISDIPPRSFRISIMDNPTNGYVYREEHDNIKTKFGIASFVIGNGKISNPSTPISSIDFLSRPHYIKIEYDENNSNKYTEISTSQLISVPYSIVAGKVTLNGDVNGTSNSNKVEKIQSRPISTIKPNTGQVLKWDGTLWTPEDDEKSTGGGTGTVTSINAGTGLEGGVIVKSGTISIAPTGVSSGKFGDASNIPIITVNSQGQITNLVTIPVSNSGGQNYWSTTSDNRFIYNKFNKRILISNNSDTTLNLNSSNSYPGLQVRYASDDYIALGFEGPGGLGYPFLQMGRKSSIAGFKYNTSTSKFDIYGTGSKSFVMDHPLDSNSSIVYSCIEGPEAAAYERGTARLINGRAEVSFSEHFNLVINPSTTTIILTPLSLSSKGLAVIEKTANSIKVGELNEGIGTYEFDWEVKGVRKGFEQYQVIRPKSEYSISGSSSNKD